MVVYFQLIFTIYHVIKTTRREIEYMLKIFKNFKGKEWILFAISIIFIVSQVWLDLKLPDYMSEITKLVQTPGSEMSEILTSGGWMLLCALGSLVASIIVAALAAKIAANLSARLRFKMFDKVQSFSMEEINNFSTASLITRSTNDITQIQIFIVMGLQALVKAPILAVWAILKIVGRNLAVVINCSCCCSFINYYCSYLYSISSSKVYNTSTINR